MKKSLVVVLLLVVIGVVAFVFKDSLFGTKKIIKGEEFSLIKNSQPSSSALNQIPSDAFFLSYQVSKSDLSDKFWIKYLQASLKGFLQPESSELRQILEEIQDSQLVQYLNDFNSKSSDKILQDLRNTGVTIPTQAYFYNVGIRPVLKIAVNEDKFKNYLASKSFEVKGEGENLYYAYSVKDIVIDISKLTGTEITQQDLVDLEDDSEIYLAMVVKDGFLNITIDADFLNAENLNIALGLEAPQKKFSFDKLKSDFEANKLATNSSATWLNLQGLANELLATDGEVMGLIMQEASKNETQFTENDKVCMTEALSLVKNFPLIVSSAYTYTNADKFALESNSVLQINSQAGLEGLKRVESSFTQLQADSAIGVGVGVNLGELYTFIKDRIEDLNLQGWKCEELSQIAFEAKSLLPKINVLNVFSWVNGASLSASGTSKQDVTSTVSLDSNNYKAMGGHLDMVTGMSGFEVLANGKSFSDLQDGEKTKLNEILIKLLIASDADAEMQKKLEDSVLSRSGDSLVLKYGTNDEPTKLQKGLFALQLNSAKIKSLIDSFDLYSEDLQKAEVNSIFNPYMETNADYKISVENKGLGFKSSSVFDFKE